MKRTFVSCLLCVAIVLGMCACGDSVSTTNSDVEPAAEVQQEQQEKLSIWERSNEDIIASIKEDLEGQDYYDGTFSVSEHESEDGTTIYPIYKNAVYTQCAFSFLKDKNTGRDKIVFMCIDSTASGAMEALVVGASAIMMEGDTAGNYETLRQAAEDFEEKFDEIQGSTDTKTVSSAAGDIEYTLGVTGKIVMFTIKAASDADTASASGNTADKETTAADTAKSSEQEETIGQRNALKAAKNYLEYSAFSYTGLVEQLEYEEYSHEDAVYAVEHCGADWNEQAAKAAQNYLEYSAFSKNGLIEQLEYEGFTNEQAVYGVEAAGY